MISNKDSKKVQSWIINLFNDPLTKILLKNSYLTKIQLESLLIDCMVEEIIERNISYEEKAKLRLSNGGVSRGSFNRTLFQARNNISSAIFTLFLLGYVGLIDTINLDYFIEISHMLKNYIESYKNTIKKEFIDDNKINKLLYDKNKVVNSLRDLFRQKRSLKKDI